MNRLCNVLGYLFVVTFCGICPVFGAEWKTLPGHVPVVVNRLTPNGSLPATNELALAIGVPLRDPQGLSDFLAQLYNPASPNFRHYLTPDEFTRHFGPTEADYAAVQTFARTNGFTITKTHGNRLVLDVKAPVSVIEKSFHISLRTYHHPTEARDFFAPDSEPVVDAQLPIVDISGLNNFSRPHPKVLPYKAGGGGIPRIGSGYDSSYFGNDFRSAYVSGTSLTGAGQTFGVFEFDGFYSNDITAYEAAAGISHIPVQTVLVDGVNGIPGFSGISGADDEVSLDIELGMAMAPGLSKVMVFEGDAQNDILEAMVASNEVQQISCSWGWPNGPSATTDSLFQEMAAQGQSFFSASGDGDAFTIGSTSENGVDNPDSANAPSSSPYITQVGGTILSTSAAGSPRTFETVWNVADGVGSSGGVSSYYSIPAWQTNISMTANAGSTTQRNIPDVAMAADDILVYSEDGGVGVFQGTSCAAPLWAGFTALVNQKAASVGAAPMGFINPALYRLAKVGTQSSTYGNYFYDITSGNNEWSSSPSRYLAEAGYDLCTGLGSPAGTNLINSLVSMDDPLHLLPAGGFTAAGMVGGQFSAESPILVLTNQGPASLSWDIFGMPAWLTASPASGTITSSNQTGVNIGFNSATTNLQVGSYSALLWFSNVTTHIAQSRPFTLQVLPMVVPATGFSAGGPFGGPFSQNLSILTVTNSGSGSFDWFLINTSAWLMVSPTNGTLATTGATAELNLGLSDSTTTFPAGVYAATLQFTNLTSHTLQLVPATLSIGQNLIENGGFETGDFTDWELTGDSEEYTNGELLIYNGVVNADAFSGASAYIYSGSYAAILGENGFLATISQGVSTVPGESYLVSFWLVNPESLPTEQFEVKWNGGTVYNILNPQVLGWTNVNLVVSATDTNTVLEFAVENDQDYFGLDDVSVTAIPILDFSKVQKLANNYELKWDATAGLVYQVQYKTNLFQPNWISLGGPITASTNILSFADTNSLIISPQRYYRLKVSP